MAELFTLSPLFPGDSEVDQIFRVCAICGTPTYFNDDCKSYQRTTPGGIWPEGIRLAGLMNFKFPNMQPKPLESIILDCPRAPLEIIASCLSYDPSTRPSAVEVLRNQWFDGLIFDENFNRICNHEALKLEPRKKLPELHTVSNQLHDEESLDDLLSSFGYPLETKLKPLTISRSNACDALPIIPHIDHHIPLRTNQLSTDQRVECANNKHSMRSNVNMHPSHSKNFNPVHASSDKISNIGNKAKSVYSQPRISELSSVSAIYSAPPSIQNVAGRSYLSLKIKPPPKFGLFSFFRRNVTGIYFLIEDSKNLIWKPERFAKISTSGIQLPSLSSHAMTIHASQGNLNGPRLITQPLIIGKNIDSLPNTRKRNSFL